MQAWAAALISIISIAAVLLLAYFVMRIFYPNQLEAIFAIGEEKLSLTKSDSRVHYYAAQTPEAPADIQQKQQQQKQQQQQQKQQQPQHKLRGSREDVESDATVGRSSPGDTTGSDYEAANSLPRANSAESLASDTSVMDLQPDVSAVGQVELGLEYDRDISELVVSIIQARDLGSATAANEVDFYAKVCVTPDAANVQSQTKVIKKNPNPNFKERFLYSLEAHQIGQKTVQVQLYSIDKYARHRHIGESEVRLVDVDLQRPLRLWLNLRELDQKPADHGELMFSLSYLPTAERLTVVIVKAKNLKWPRPDQVVGDVLVKVHLILNGKRVAKKKTSVKKSESQPTYNEAMIFSVSQGNLSSVQLRLTVADVGADGKLTSVGHVIIGSQTGGPEMTHWQQMVTSLRRPVAMWHHLRKK